jgi:hypothetical protein
MPKSWLSRLRRSTNAPRRPEEEAARHEHQPFPGHELEDGASAAAQGQLAVELGDPPPEGVLMVAGWPAVLTAKVKTAVRAG